MNPWSVQPFEEPKEYTTSPRSLVNGTIKKRALAKTGLGNMMKGRRAGGAIGFDLRCPFHEWADAKGNLAHSSTQDPRRDSSTTFFEGGKYDGLIICQHQSCGHRKQREFWEHIAVNCPEAGAVLHELEPMSLVRGRAALADDDEWFQAHPPVSLEEGRRTLAFRMGERTGGILYVDAPAGLGKSTAARDIAAERKGVGLVSNTHANLIQLQVGLEGKGGGAKRHVGLLSYDHEGQKCQNPELVEVAYQHNADPNLTVCPHMCEFYETCEVRGHIGQGVPIGVHQSVRAIAKAASLLLFIDEEGELLEESEFPPEVDERALYFLEKGVRIVPSSIEWGQVRTCMMLNAEAQLQDGGSRRTVKEKRQVKDPFTGATTTTSVVFKRRTELYQAMRNHENVVILAAGFDTSVLDGLNRADGQKVEQLVVNVMDPLADTYRIWEHASTGARRWMCPNGEVNWAVTLALFEKGATKAREHDAKKILAAAHMPIVLGIKERVPGSEKVCALLDDLEQEGRALVLRHYGADDLRGSNAYMDVDATLSIGDPWPSKAATLEETELLDAPDADGRYYRKVRSELYQFHERARNMLRGEGKRAICVHVGSVPPLRWGSGVTVGWTPGGRPESDKEAVTQDILSAIEDLGGVSEAADIVARSPSTVWGWLREGRIPAWAAAAFQESLRVLRGCKKSGENLPEKYSERAFSPQRGMEACDVGRVADGLRAVAAADHLAVQGAVPRVQDSLGSGGHEVLGGPLEAAGGRAAGVRPALRGPGLGRGEAGAAPRPGAAGAGGLSPGTERLRLAPGAGGRKLAARVHRRAHVAGSRVRREGPGHRRAGAHAGERRGGGLLGHGCPGVLLRAAGSEGEGHDHALQLRHVGEAVACRWRRARHAAGACGPPSRTAHPDASSSRRCGTASVRWRRWRTACGSARGRPAGYS